MKTKVLVTGARGMLGSALYDVLQNDFDVYGLALERDSRPRFSQCDITDRIATIRGVERVNPKIVIHAAAMTDVDACEHNRQAAMKVNFEGTKNVVDGARHVKAIVIYISTDFVFSGRNPEPYKETRIPHPVNVYGESKLLGEFYVREQSSQYLILRTAWLFGPGGNNFITKILKQAGETKELRVVQDQRGSPTFTHDLAGAIRAVIQGSENDRAVLNGIYHVANSGVASRYEVACEVLRQMGRSDIVISPIESAEVRMIAQRPQNSAFDTTRFEKAFGLTPRPWQEALAEYIKMLSGNASL